MIKKILTINLACYKLSQEIYNNYIFCYFCSEYNEFLDELEEDPELRHNINIFKDTTKQIPVDTNEIDPSIPQITLEEMLDDLAIEDIEMTEVHE